MRAPSKHKRFEEQLVAAGAVSVAQMELAVREQKRNGSNLGQTLVELGFIAPEALAEFLAKEAGARAVNLHRIAIDQAVLILVPPEVAKSLQALPLSRHDHTLTVALADPSNVVAVDTLHHITGLQIDVVTAPRRDILAHLDLYYGTGDTIEQSIDKVLEEKSRDGAPSLEDILRRLGNSDEDAPVIRLISQIITRAVNSGASDIHFGPEERMMRIRTRIDGVLFQDLLIPKALQSAVTTRMKILAELDLANSFIPQDGRAAIMVGGREVSLRVSSLPTRFGENVVVRILDSNARALTLPSLGLTPEMQTQIRQAINEPYGVILVTGPTGSGKTTTLYAVLEEVSTIDVSVFTLEDPIEYVMPMVRQTQIREEMGLTFSSGLRSLLRQDPDIILVGETRDTETAQLMVRAALTGHLVFSTLHTNDAPGAIPRLLDMGVEPYLLPSSLIAVVGQRLVRSICPSCKAEVPDPARVFEQLKLSPQPEGTRLYRGTGCAECKNSGFRGRRGIYELMRVDERFHEPIVRRAASTEYLWLAKEGGMKTMFEDGLLKATQGITTVDELLRVTRLEN